MKNKTIFFKTWPSSGRLDAYLAKNMATIKNVLYKRTPLHRLKEYNESIKTCRSTWNHWKHKNQ